MKQLFAFLLLLLGATAFAQSEGSVMITDRTFLKDGDGNLGLSLTFHNGTEKTVKHIKITVWPMDMRENNLCDDDGVYSLNIKLKGSLAPGKSTTIMDKYLVRDCHDQICCLKVVGMKVTFSDQTFVNIFGKDMANYFHPSLGPDCPTSGETSQTTPHQHR